MQNPPSRPTHPKSIGRVAGLLVGICALVAALLLASFFLRVFPPQVFYQNQDIAPTYDGTAMQNAVDPAQVSRQQAALLKFGSRFLGEPGTHAAGEYIADTFRKAGLDVIEHQVTTASPLTDYREIYRQSPGSTSYLQDQKLSDVQVYPFFPNFLQPVTTGSAGLTGKLVLATPEHLRSGSHFENEIALVDIKPGGNDPDYGCNWARYARAGFKAVIVSDSLGMNDGPWPAIAGRIPGNTTMVSSSPVNYVRLAATPEIFKHVGEDIRLRVKVRFVAAPNTTYYGVFHAAHPAHQAIALLVPYDVPSVLPDSAPGGAATVSPAFALQFLAGLQHYRDSIQRDVIFIAYGSSMMGEDGVNHLARILQANTKDAQDNNLLKALGITTKPSENKRISHLQANEDANHAVLLPVQEVKALFGDSAFLSDVTTTNTAIAHLSAAARKVVEDQFSYIMDSLVLELSEPVLQRKLAFLRLDRQNVQSPEFRAYLAAKQMLDPASDYAGYSPASLLQENRDIFEQYNLRGRFAARIAELVAYHQHAERQLEQEKAIARLFDTYDDVSFFGCRLVPSADKVPPTTESVILDVGQNQGPTPRGQAVFNIFSNAGKHLPAGCPAVSLVTPDQANYAIPGGDATNTSVTNILDNWGYSTYTIYSMNHDSAYGDFPSPVIQPWMVNLETLRGSFQVYANALLAFAHGLGPDAPSVVDEWFYFSFGGQVLVSGVGESVVPHYPLDGAAVANHPLENQELFSHAGRYESPIILVDPYGKYRLEYNSNDFASMWRVFVRNGYSPIACGYDDDGFIKFMKDEGEDGQQLFKSYNINLFSSARENTTIVTFRAAPVSLLDLTNPQTMADYSNISLVTREGLDEPSKEFSMASPGVDTTYLEPDRHSYVLLQAGAPGNDLVQETRAFMLGIEDPLTYQMTRDIDGPGYLAADTTLLRDVPFQSGKSMAAVNGHRLDLLRHYHMDDEQSDEYQGKTLDNLEVAEKTDQSLHEATHSARDAVTYATLNHPVIRQKVIEAVISIIWYLALLVPFVFFFEKLAFGFTDVRLQITAQVAIFLIVFGLLWILHPAFAMVRSSLMILLGFVIILISGGIALLFSSKFKENLEDLRKRQGRVAGAEVNTMGVLGSAFLLGLNNMHRRKVRTGLTCATLTLLTFVMISFTSVQNSVVEEDIAIGKAAYQGLLIKREHFEALSDSEVFAFRSKYAEKYNVCLRRFALGSRYWQTGKRTDPEWTLNYQDAAGTARTFKFHSVLQMDPDEPLQGKIEMVGKPAWFTKEQVTDGVCPILISDKAASSVGISSDQIATTPGGVPVKMNGTDFLVIGIFKSDSLDQLRDLDGQDMRPFDIEAVPELVSTKDRGYAVRDTSPRIPGEEMFISPLRDVGSPTPRSGPSIGFPIANSSLAISMPKAGYKEASSQIVSFMEQIAEPVYYGLDGEAFKGKRTREVTLAGLIDLIIPLIIAGLTVLNTMSGSVYERRDEIFVYNAVGIAPRYIFIMFMAEAMVYAVVGSVLGYLLSQGVGRILTELGWTGGLNMTYTSLSTIYASLTIMAAVFVSTYFPARSAMEIAKPADETGWSLPEPDGDVLSFDLPFNFLSRGRMAVLMFFDRYLLDHAEGGMGSFSAATPKLAMQTTTGGETIPCLETTVWLKPFDLAVSQRVIISMPRDEQTDQFKARIELIRLSGTRESWLRLNKSFVLLVRRHFLYWRAVGPAEQEEMFLEARTKFEQDVLSHSSKLVEAT